MNKVLNNRVPKHRSMEDLIKKIAERKIKQEEQEEHQTTVDNNSNSNSVSIQKAEETVVNAQMLLELIFPKNIPSLSPSPEVNNDSNDPEEEDEWRVAYKKLDRDACKNNSREEERRRQMAKNREYARKCVQKKKDARKQAEIKNIQYLRLIEQMKNSTLRKERNSNFAVDLRKMMKEENVEDIRKNYELRKSNFKQEFDRKSAADETVNVNFHRLACAREEFEKAAEDLNLKKGVIGTLGSRKIRAKQQMEWRSHLYYISVHEQTLRLEKNLAEIADDYVKCTVPAAAPLVTSIPKDLLDELIQNNRTSELEEFCRFVSENQGLFEDPKEPVVK